MDKRTVDSYLRPLLIDTHNDLISNTECTPLCPLRTDFDKSHHLRPTAKRISVRQKTVRSEDTERNRDRLGQANGPWNRGSAEDDRGEEAGLNAVGQVVLDAIAADGVFRSFR